MLGIFTTNSRGGWIAAGVSVLVLLVLAETVRAVSSKAAIGAFVALAVAFLLIAPASSADETSKEYRTETLRGRVVFLAEAFEKQAGVLASL